MNAPENKPAIIHQYVKQGGTFTFDFRITVNGEPITFSGMEVKSQVREKKDRTSALIADMVTGVDPQTGTVVISISSAETAEIPCGDYWYDVAFVDRTSEPPIVDYWVEGKFVVDGSSTEVTL